MTGRHIYPIGLFGTTFWMLANYQFPAADSYDYGDDSGNEATFGRLYNSPALSQPPDGWRCPLAVTGTRCSASSPTQAYTALTPGAGPASTPRSAARRSIQADGAGHYQHMFVYGYYWAAPGKRVRAVQRRHRAASASAPSPTRTTGLSVRFIRHA